MIPTAPVPSLAHQLRQTLSDAIAAAFPDHAGADPLVRPSDRADLQANAALALAKKVGANPRQVAEQIAEQLAGSNLISSADVSGPGFINLTISDAGLWRQVGRRREDDRLGVPASQDGVRTVVDYSGPNIAKEMHVGHLRSSIIGDALVRVLEFLGSDVVRQNHLGDWGTQFGMLIQFIDEHLEVPWRAEELTETSAVSALDGLYKRARAEFDADGAFADRSRARVVALQGGDPDTLATWREIVAQSQQFFTEVYRRLGLRLTGEDAAGESFYNPMLPAVATELADSGVATESDGALVFLSEKVNGPDDRPAALIVRKSDGGYGYDTTDLATLRYRVRDLGAQQILYVVGAPQALHFRLVFEAATKAGWLTSDMSAAHVPFGSVLGADGKPFKTRAGASAKLMDLLDEAVDAARAVVRESAQTKGADPQDPALDVIAEQAGIAAIKYADLSSNRIKDYTFDPERMVSFTGNTGVYLQYAHTRLVSILRKAAERGLSLEGDDRTGRDAGTRGDDVRGDAGLTPRANLEPAERGLALALDEFGAAVEQVADTLEPHTLCTYTYELARAFTEFYEACPVLSSDGGVRQRRLLLVDLTRRTLAQALDLLGIAAPERM